MLASARSRGTLVTAATSVLAVAVGAAVGAKPSSPPAAAARRPQRPRRCAPDWAVPGAAAVPEHAEEVVPELERIAEGEACRGEPWAEVIEPPSEYDDEPDCYAVFFRDPDGFKLEVLHVRR